MPRDSGSSLLIPGGAVNAASFQAGPIAAGQIIVVYSLNAVAEPLVAGTPLPAELGGARYELIDSAGAVHALRFIYAAPGQAALLVPGGAAPGRAILRLHGPAGLASSLAVEVARVSPGLFAQNANGQGVAAANVVTYRDGVPSVSAAARFEGGVFVPGPIDLGAEGDQVFLFLYGTGMRGASSASATVGGEPVGVAGPVAQGELEGLDQINLGPLPRSLAGRGIVEIAVAVDGIAVNKLTVSMQ